jgi:hypothetical protein
VGKSDVTECQRMETNLCAKITEGHGRSPNIQNHLSRGEQGAGTSMLHSVSTCEGKRHGRSKQGVLNRDMGS